MAVGSINEVAARLGSTETEAFLSYCRTDGESYFNNLPEFEDRNLFL